MNLKNLVMLIGKLKFYTRGTDMNDRKINCYCNPKPNSKDSHPIRWTEVNSLSKIIALVKSSMISSWEGDYKLSGTLFCPHHLKYLIIFINSKIQVFAFITDTFSKK